MAKLHHQQKIVVDKVSFKAITLFKKKTLGIGSYGKVCQAKCDDLLCAAKLMHETLFDPTNQHLVVPEKEHRLPIRRFEKECGYLNTVRHPNIVQCLCIFEDPDTGLPVLLMELMDDSLTHFLDTSPRPVPYNVQVSICHDITLALSHLHSNGIVHRDLSSNNVLLIGSIRAKLSDFGMAKLGDISHTFTMCPGTDVYMPPESVDDNPLYTEKIDCFSFGVIVVQILTRQFPKPDDRYKLIELYHPEVHGRKVKVCIPEVDRRQNHISIIDQKHPLLQVALDCLKDGYEDRPSAQQLCKKMSALKSSPEYEKSRLSVNQASIVEQERKTELEKEVITLKKQHDQEVKSLRKTVIIQERSLEEKDENIAQLLEERYTVLLQKDEVISNSEETIQQLRQELQQCMEEMQKLQKENEEIKERQERQLGRLRHQLEVSEHSRTEIERQFHELDQDQPQRLMNQPPMTPVEVRGEFERRTTSTIKIKWAKGRRAPCKMSGTFSAALLANTVYVLPPDKIIYAYSENTFTWSKFASCPVSDCPLVIVKSLLTLIGGICNDQCISKVLSLTGEGAGRRWSQEFPSMPTKRYGMAALSAGIALIVAGGIGNDYTVLMVVEILNTETNQWSTAANLPCPITYSIATVCDGQVYVLGGEDRELEPTKAVYTCKLTSLLKSTNPKSVTGRFRDTLRRSNKPKVWSQVSDLPVVYPSCAFLHGCLLAIGGRESDLSPTTAIHAYAESTNTWEVISHMAIPRCNCLAAVLSDSQLMVVGGVIDKIQTKTDRVEMGAVIKLVIA